jgi:hypothetical protein
LLSETPAGLLWAALIFFVLMPSWSELLTEVNQTKDFDGLRRKYLGILGNTTERNVIAYYSGWLQKEVRGRIVSISDTDMDGFMTTVHKTDRAKGLDLLLHTPGGEINATEAIVNYLRYAFNNDIRVIVPQVSMSAGTMIALASREVWMGMHSSLGPIDPQVNGAPAHGIRDEFKKAAQAFKDNPYGAEAWKPILTKYSPTLLGECDNAIEMAEKIVGDWLETGMLKGITDEQEKKKVRQQILDEFGSHAKSLNHGRHFNYDKVKAAGVVVQRLEDNKPLQDAVLSVHHAFVLTLSATHAIKIIQNNVGGCFVNGIPAQMAMPQ